MAYMYMQFFTVWGSYGACMTHNILNHSTTILRIKGDRSRMRVKIREFF